MIVVDAGGEQEVAFAGDLVVRAAARRGVAGMVIDGAIRDRAEIAGMPFPVFHRGTSPRGPTKRFPGGVQVPIELRGVPVSPVTSCASTTTGWSWSTPRTPPPC